MHKRTNLALCRKIQYVSYIHSQEIDGKAQRKEKRFPYGFIDLEKLMIGRNEVIWQVIDKKHVYKLYIDAIKDKYDRKIISAQAT